MRKKMRKTWEKRDVKYYGLYQPIEILQRVVVFVVGCPPGVNREGNCKYELTCEECYNKMYAAKRGGSWQR